MVMQDDDARTYRGDEWELPSGLIANLFDIQWNDITTADDAEELHEILRGKALELKSQIDAYEADQRDDPDWYRRCNYALRKTQALEQRAQSHRGRLRRRDQKSLERRFMEAARIRLGDDAFHQILGIARSGMGWACPGCAGRGAVLCAGVERACQACGGNGVRARPEPKG